MKRWLDRNIDVAFLIPVLGGFNLCAAFGYAAGAQAKEHEQYIPFAIVSGIGLLVGLSGYALMFWHERSKKE